MMADPIASSLLDGQLNYGTDVENRQNGGPDGRQGPKCMSDGGIATFGWPWDNMPELKKAIDKHLLVEHLPT